jgi:hypothetical protein
MIKPITSNDMVQNLRILASSDCLPAITWHKTLTSQAGSGWLQAVTWNHLTDY